MRALRRCCLLPLVVAAGCATVQPDAETRDLYRKATRSYDLENYQKAAGLYEQAYARTPDFHLLYNIAQSYRMGGDCGRAVPFYRQFMDAVRWYHTNADHAARATAAGHVETCLKSSPPAATPASAAPEAARDGGAPP